MRVIQKLLSHLIATTVVSLLVKFCRNTMHIQTCFPAIDCGLAPEVANGSSSTNGSALYSVATYTCSVGYRLSGENEYLVCQEDELWSGQLPICESESV